MNKIKLFISTITLLGALLMLVGDVWGCPICSFLSGILLIPIVLLFIAAMIALVWEFVVAVIIRKLSNQPDEEHESEVDDN